MYLVKSNFNLAYFRLNYRYTVAILIAFAVIVSHRQFSESGNYIRMYL